MSRSIDSTLIFGGNIGERIGFPDGEWAIIGTPTPSELGRGCRPAQDSRLYFEGTMRIARRGGFSVKLNARCDAKSHLLRFGSLFRMTADKIEALLADKG